MMRGLRSMTGAIFGLMAAVLIGCEAPAGPPIAIEGGGFVFNVRIAEVFYGVAVKPLRKLEPGSVLVATFEDPDGGPDLVVTETVAGGKLSYGLRTPAVTGVRAGQPYRVVVMLIAPGGDKIARLERTFRSDLDQEASPERPLTIGPGYTPNPDADPSARGRR
jgi:hypothetical protein